MPDRGGRAGRFRYVRGHQARRQGSRGTPARRCPHRARPERRGLPSIWTRRCSSIRRASSASAESATWSSSPTSSSSAPASAARRSLPALPASGADILILEAGDRHRRPAGEPRPAGDLPARPFPAEGDLVRDGRHGVQSRQLLQCRRQFEILRRGADALSRARISRRCSIWTASRRPGPFPMRNWSPGTARRSSCIRCAASLGEDPTEPPHSQPYAFPPVPDEPAIASVRERAEAQRPASAIRCRSASTSTSGSPRRSTPWDAHPNSVDGKMDAETAALAVALQHPNVRLKTGARVTRLETAGDGRRIEAVHYTARWRSRRVVAEAGHPVGRCGAIGGAAAALGQRRASEGARQPLRSGRPQFHEPQFLARCWRSRRSIATIRSTRRPSASTISISRTAQGGPPLGNVQLLGRDFRHDPQGEHADACRNGCSNSISAPCDRFLRDERGSAASRKAASWSMATASCCNGCAPTGRRISMLVKKLKARACKAAGFPIVLSRPFDKRTPSHQCGTVRIGNDPASARRSMSIAGPSITRTCSSSMPASCRPRRPSIRR